MCWCFHKTQPAHELKSLLLLLLFLFTPPTYVYVRNFYLACLNITYIVSKHTAADILVQMHYQQKYM